MEFPNSSIKNPIHHDTIKSMLKHTNELLAYESPLLVYKPALERQLKNHTVAVGLQIKDVEYARRFRFAQNPTAERFFFRFLAVMAFAIARYHNVVLRFKLTICQLPGREGNWPVVMVTTPDKLSGKAHSRLERSLSCLAAPPDAKSLLKLLFGREELNNPHGFAWPQRLAVIWEHRLFPYQIHKGPVICLVDWSFDKCLQTFDLVATTQTILWTDPDNPMRPLCPDNVPLGIFLPLRTRAEHEDIILTRFCRRLEKRLRREVHHRQVRKVRSTAVACIRDVKSHETEKWFQLAWGIKRNPQMVAKHR